MILTILVIAIGAWVCGVLVKFGLWYLNSYRLLLRSNCFRGPRAFPLIGSAHLFLGDMADIYSKLQEVIAKYQSPFRLWLGPRLYFVLHEPEHFKLILLSPNALEKDSFYELVKPLMGNGLGLAPVPMWKAHRKVIEPLFSTTVMDSFVPIIVKNALTVVKKMGMEMPDSEFDVQHYMSRYSFDSICETSMGICLDATNNDCPLFHTVESVLEVIAMRMVKPWLQPDFIFKYTPVGQTYYKDVAYIRDFAKDNWNKTKSELLNEIETRPRKYLARQLLAEDGYKFTGKEVCDHIITTIGSGYETTALLLSHAILMLAKYPNIQDKAYAEVREIFGDFDGSDITLQHIHRMQYMDRLLKETLRFFPSFPTLLRYLSKEINIGDYTLPAGSSVMINMMATHRNEKYWPRPLEFNPDRFLPDHPLGPRHPCAFLPFSLGSRNCIGIKYGMVSAKILLATLVSRYIIKTRVCQEPANMELNIGMTLKMKNPILVSIERRGAWKQL